MEADDTDVVRKVVLLDAVEVFECHGDLTMNKFMYDLLKDDQLLFINPVPVLNTSLQRIGFATVNVEDDNLDTKVFITKECPERLDIENGEPYFLGITAATLPVGATDNVYSAQGVMLTSAKGGKNLPLVTKGAF